MRSSDMAIPNRRAEISPARIGRIVPGRGREFFSPITSICSMAFLIGLVSSRRTRPRARPIWRSDCRFLANAPRGIGRTTSRVKTRGYWIAGPACCAGSPVID